jgi:hypothetical protein
MKEGPEFLIQVYTLVSGPDDMCLRFIINGGRGQVFTEVRY